MPDTPETELSVDQAVDVLSSLQGILVLAPKVANLRGALQTARAATQSARWEADRHVARKQDERGALCAEIEELAKARDAGRAEFDERRRVAAEAEKFIEHGQAVAHEVSEAERRLHALNADLQAVGAELERLRTEAEQQRQRNAACEAEHTEARAIVAQADDARAYLEMMRAAAVKAGALEPLRPPAAA